MYTKTDRQHAKYSLQGDIGDRGSRSLVRKNKAVVYTQHFIIVM